MKPVLLSLAVIFCSVLTTQAQNWACFYPNDTAYYLDDNDQMYGLAVVDSTVDVGVVKYKVFRTIGYDNTCQGTASYGLNINKPTWAGPEIHKMPNGDYCFFNELGDTITIKTTAPYRVPWICHISSTNDTLFAQVYYEDTMTVDGVLDSVKTVLFSANAPFSNLANVSQLELKLTKQHGLLTIPKMYTFPFEQQYQGLTKTNIRPLTWGEVYNYSIGDYYQVLQTRVGYSGIDSVLTYKELLDKNIFNNGNSVSYTFNRERLSVHNSGFVNVSYDTVVETYDNLLGNVGGGLPDAVHYTGDAFEPLSIMNMKLNVGQPFTDLQIRRAAQMIIYFDFEELNDTCWNTSTVVDGYVPPYYFECIGPLIIEGIGFDGIYNDRVVYYNLCGQQGGTKMAVGIPELPDAQVKIFPNPASDVLELDNTSNNEYSVSIVNLQGQTIKTITATANTKTSIDVSSMALGVYIIRFNDGQSAYFKKVIIAR